jgi:hypothetical protein
MAQGRNGNGVVSVADMVSFLSGLPDSDISEGVYGNFVVLHAGHKIVLREARRNTENNRLPTGVERSAYDTTYGGCVSSIHEMMERYYGHILNNQAESAMIAAKKATPAGASFDRVASLHAWRLKKIADEINSSAGLGAGRGPTMPSLSERDKMARNEAFIALRASAVKQGQGDKFPDRLTAKALEYVVSKGRTLDVAIAALLASPFGVKIYTKVDEILAKAKEAVEADDDAIMAALGMDGDESEEDETEDESEEDESEGEPEQPTAA